MAKKNNKKALIIKGGWEGHDPDATTTIIAGELCKHNFQVKVMNELKILADVDKLRQYDLISIHWTMGTLEEQEALGLTTAVSEYGIGFAGYHGGSGDAFRDNFDFQMMVGGQFVGHPYVGPYQVYFDGAKHPITEGMTDFEILSTEMYYMHVDPANLVLATCRAGKLNEVIMPVVWVKSYGKGKVFYNSLGHDKKIVRQKQVKELIIKGFLWAAK